MAKLVKVNGEVSDVFPKDAAGGFTLAELYALIGCSLVQVVQTRDRRIQLVIDEEGKFTEKGRNALATTMLHEAGGDPSDWIVGDALVVTRGELGP